MQTRQKTSSYCPRFCSFPPSLSLRCPSHQPEPPPAPPHIASPTTSRPPPRPKQSPFLSLSHLCKILLPSPVINSGHRSSQRRHRNHQLNLLITAETPLSSELLLRRPPFLQPFRLHAERELLFTFCT